MSFGLGSFDRDNLDNLNTPRERLPNNGISDQNKDTSFQFPCDSEKENVYIDPDAISDVVKTTIETLSEEDKKKALEEYYTSKLSSESSKQDLKERRNRLKIKENLHRWVGILLASVSVLLILSVAAIVATVVYTSLISGSMTESGIIPAMVSFFTEIIKTLVTS